MYKIYLVTVLTIVSLSIACSSGDDNDGTQPGSSGTGGPSAGSGGTTTSPTDPNNSGGSGAITANEGTDNPVGTGGNGGAGTGGQPDGTDDGPPRCGDGKVDTSAGEFCEQGVALNATCESLGHMGGVLSCDTTTCQYDVSSCTDDPDGGGLNAGGYGGTSGNGGTGGSTGIDVPSGGILPEVDSVEEDGPFAATSDPSGPHHVWRPTELGQNGLKHPVFVWGTGFGSTPANYDDFFIRFATHGFVVVAPTPASLSTSDMSDALNWIVEQNDTQGSIYYQKLDLERIAMGGHSQGSMATFNVEATETRLKTTIHIAGGSSDGLGSSKVKTPTAYICGETDFLLPQCQTDFANVEDQPTFFSEVQGADHIYCARMAMPGMIAWLRWHLGGETWRSAMFTGPDGEFFQGIWQSQTKNWNW